MQCPACEKGTLIRRTVPYEVYGIKLGNFEADVCNQCGEQWFDENVALEIEKREKEKGLFGMVRKTKIGYSGNSLILRIPKAMAEALHLKKEGEVTLIASKNQIIIEI